MNQATTTQEEGLAVLAEELTGTCKSLPEWAEDMEEELEEEYEIAICAMCGWWSCSLFFEYDTCEECYEQETVD